MTDFTTRTLASLDELQRLSFVIEMTPTEYDRIKAAKPDDANYYGLIAASANVRDARVAAKQKLRSFNIRDTDSYRKIWASDFLTDEQMRRYADCVSGRQPGLDFFGRRDGPGRFQLTIVHLTPIGIEKVDTTLLASSNVANAVEFGKYLSDIGYVDNFSGRTFPLEIVDPAKPAVVLMRSGWETPKLVMIPPFGIQPPAREAHH